MSQEIGKRMEPFLTDLAANAYEAAPQYDTEEERELSPEELSRINCKGGQVDNIMVGSDGTPFLLELKMKGVYRYLDVVKNGIPGDEQLQMQAYMKAKGVSKALYIAGNMDRSALTKASRGKERPRGIWETWLPAKPLTQQAGLDRANMLHSEIAKEDPATVTRQYNPDPSKGKVDWNCDWCPFKRACLKAGER